MTDSIHPRVKDRERKIYSLTGVGPPTTTAPDAPVGTDYSDVDPDGGGLWYKYSSGWSELATASAISWDDIEDTPTTVSGYGITDVYDKDESDARYLRLAGGTTTGAVAFGDTIQVTGAATTEVTSGAGVELHGGSGPSVVAYNRGADFYVPLIYDASTHLIRASGTTILTVASTGLTASGALSVTGTIRSTSAAGFAIGSISGVSRVMYGVSGSTAFSLLTADNSFADLFAHDGNFSGACTVIGDADIEGGLTVGGSGISVSAGGLAVTGASTFSSTVAASGNITAPDFVLA